MEECKEFFQTLKYFVEKAFPKKKEIWTQFAFSDFDTAKRSETKMIQLFGIIDKSAKEYKNQLIAAGFGQDKIDQIQTLQTELIAADYDQEISKKKRPAITQERVLILNECFGFMQRAGKAGKIIFKSNYAKYNQYLLPSEREEKKAEEPVTPQAS